MSRSAQDAESEPAAGEGSDHGRKKVIADIRAFADSDSASVLRLGVSASDSVYVRVWTRRVDGKRRCATPSPESVPAAPLGPVARALGLGTADQLLHVEQLVLDDLGLMLRKGGANTLDGLRRLTQ